MFVGYASRQGSTLLDRRRSVPQEWGEEERYAQRRHRWGVPAALPVKTQPPLGWEMIQAGHQAPPGRARWGTWDEACGRATPLLDPIDRLGLWYFAEGPHDTQGWQQRPPTAVPPWSGPGRTPTRSRVLAGEAEPAEVALLAAALPADRWVRRPIQDGRTGPLVAHWAALRVIAGREGVPGPEVGLVLRRHRVTGALQTSLAKAPAATPLAPLVRLRGLRGPSAPCFEDGKQYLGMGDDEGRSWRGGHHHRTRCIVAPGFLVRAPLR